MPFAKVSQDLFYKVSYKIFHQPFLLDFVKFSVLSLFWMNCYLKHQSPMVETCLRPFFTVTSFKI
ncbi:MAG TPA: hypothetical protein HPP56_03650 [Nitrospirae bacterium]|nr:hypothetical protein [Nitrospirota bacterium]